MDHNYHYSSFHPYPAEPFSDMHAVPFYPPHDAQLAASTQEAMGVPIAHGHAVKGAQFPPFGPMGYSHPSEMGYWPPPSPFERSVSPPSDCQSNGRLSTFSYDDSMSCASGFESSPAPSYPEISVLYKRESVSSTRPTHPMPQQSPMFLQVYPAQRPVEYMTSPTSSTSETSTEALKARKASSSRKSNRVQKQTGKSPKKTPTRSNRTGRATASKQAPKKITDRRFECCFARYGCTSSFPSKNEWKRHVSSQHIQPGFYRCDVGRCSLNNTKHRSTSPNQKPSQSPSPASHESGSRPTTPALLVNDFNRKDLFVQHQRRMHAPWSTSLTSPSTPKSRVQSVPQDERDAFEASLETVSKRCWRQLRAPPTLSCCGFCSMEFRGATAWKERMEHVARHLEKRDPGPEKEDVPLREWAVDNGVIGWVRGEWRLVSLCRK